MKIFQCLLIVLFFSTALQGQSKEQITAAKAPIILMFDAMRAGDSSMLRAAFHKDIILQTIIEKEGEEPIVRTSEGPENFLQAVGTPHDEVYDERIHAYEVNINGPLATIWTPYTFYLGEKLSHCGVNAFQLVETADGWKITHIIDTRSKEGCTEEKREPAVIINELLDNWHKAAANADADAFFGSMTEDGIYLGTDATERWLRDELRSWAAAAFERETAWDFKPSKRELYFSADGNTVWFEELLDTWMGTCRGSGVLTLTNDGWKIRHYDLAIMVPNEKVEAFKEIMKQP
ncbi:MAG: nuclear transport factor 2 family protein [Chitinophagales bacterium]|nr:nuclear transport factor 2 family protein [Chitinophagales bacterium]